MSSLSVRASFPTSIQGEGISSKPVFPFTNKYTQTSFRRLGDFYISTSIMGIVSLLGLLVHASRHISDAVALHDTAMNGIEDNPLAWKPTDTTRLGVNGASGETSGVGIGK